MKRPRIFVPLIAGALAVAPRAGVAQQAAVPPPAPVILDTTGLFLARAARIGEDMFVTGQPTARALRELRAQGVTTVVNLRTPEEMTRNVPFDEPGLVAELGMRYVFLPVRGTGDYPYAPATLAQFAEAVRTAN